MKIDLSQWPRREHFEFYRNADEPYWGCCVELDVSKLYKLSKQANFSFTAALLFVATHCANNIENFRYRLQGDDVIAYETIHVSNVFMRANKLFSFGYVEYKNDFWQHCGDFKVKQAQAEHAAKIALDQESAQANTLHFSALPWLNFSSMSHARTFDKHDSCPKISIGKFTVHPPEINTHIQDTPNKPSADKANSKITLPFSVHVHHAFVDGYHMGLYIDAIQNMLDNFDTHLG